MDRNIFFFNIVDVGLLLNVIVNVIKNLVKRIGKDYRKIIKWFNIVVKNLGLGVRNSWFWI